MPTFTGPLVITSEIAFGSELIFVATDANGQSALWVSDGTVAGTRKLNTGAFPSTLSNFADFTVIGANLYFTATVPGFGAQVWSTQGVPGDLIQRMSYSAGAQVGYTIAYNGSFYFTDSRPDFGPGVYSTDGVNSFFDGSITISSQPVVVNGKMLFYGSTSQFGAGIYLSDGNPAHLTAPVALPAFATPNQVVASGAKAFIDLSIFNQGNQLWVSDGTVGGTHEVTALRAFNLTAFNGGAIFTADGGVHSSQVWFSNGTAAGTFELFINQSLDHTTSLEIGPAIGFGGKTFFIAGRNQFNIGTDTLYSTDGVTTTAIGPLNLGGLPQRAMIPLNGKLIIIGEDGAVIASDGTSAGVTLSTGVQQDGEPQLVNGKLYYMLNFSIVGTDGTAAGTSTIFSNGASSLGSAGNVLYFFYGNTVPNGPAAGLYGYNTVTHATTLLNGSVIPGSNGVHSFGVALGSELFFTSLDKQLWISDGTAAGTQQLNLNADIVGQVRPIAPADLTALNGLLYFDSRSADGSQSPALFGLWVTDGTVAGTHQVSNPDSTSVNVDAITAVGNDILFVTGVASSSLWSYDTVSHTTTLIGPSASMAPLAVLTNGLVLFAAPDANNHLQIAVANAGGGETLLSSPSNGAPYILAPSYFAAVGAKLFYVGTDSVHGEGLFVTDGTVGGTTFLASIPANFINWSFNVVGADLYFENNDPTNGDELWVSDGTVAGTHRVTDTTSPQSANASGYIVMGAKAYFTATDGVHGQELWSFNGSPGGAALVADINPGAAGSNPTDLTIAGSTLYFAATVADGSGELWSTTGTGATELTSLTNGANPADLTAVGAKLFFFGSDASHGGGLFVSNGAAGGTSFLHGFANASGFAAVGGELYFNAENADGWQLWKSDGTIAGTQQLTFARIAADDFNGDAKSDFLLQNTSGLVAIGEVAGGQAGYAYPTALPAGWSFVGTGDFIGDGKADFMIQNASGLVAIGEIGGGQASFIFPTAIDASWTFVGTGDFLGEGKDQFMLQNTSGVLAFGEVNGGQANYIYPSTLDSSWKFVGTGDFLGDGKTDFLLQNAGGLVAVGEMLNGQPVYSYPTALPSGWNFVGSGDFLADGKDQFMVENASGLVAIGEVSAGHANFIFPTALDSQWKFVGDGDYLGEGHDQFLIESSTTGAVFVGDYSGGQVHYTQVGSLPPDWVFH